MAQRGRGRPPTPWPMVRVALRALAGGATYDQAAEAAGIGKSTVKKFAAIHGVGVLRDRTLRPGALRIDHREVIFAGIARGETDGAIAATLGRHRSTIWREIKANGGRDGYRPHFAQRRADDKARRCRDAWIETRPWLWDEVIALLRTRKWSPQQIESPWV